ncbi:hypothetical protein Ait01nite_063040 [Actinoplanes italicus]|jgi:hypothetical protein|uniref:Uncharacterized protein n=2 Tax=Actinoplanes TaxID=1865 RepID=A0A2T0K4W8_9ACTN|nr:MULTISPECIES: hypothetical protein [Actinoplanes]MBW6440304.1 hypothetical protein [Actinoplanes hulinensis]PRX17959.1 hypothetical protein CLV67_114130 [Actinoplanes italicus]GIE33259.1 hypothetical protein Ait01nite_063040 [Actinoplanes italicus]
MKRLLWLGVGLAVGALVVRKLNQKANEFTPTGIATSLSESAGGLVESLRSFVEDVREGMAERENQIHEAFAAGELYEDKFAELRDDAWPGSQEEGSR